MSAPRTTRRGDPIDELMERASKALVAMRYFDAERAADEALHQAHAKRDYARMARIVMPLQEARRQRRMLAIDTGKLIRMSEGIADDAVPRPGCYLIEPPLVGADGRDFRTRALAADVPAFVLVREPRTRAGLCPLVMIGPVTVRTRIPEPKKFDLAWFEKAAEALGDQGILDASEETSAEGRVEVLLEALDTVVDHEKLHQRLEEACHEAEVEARTAPQRRRDRVTVSDLDADEEVDILLDAVDEDE